MKYLNYIWDFDGTIFDSYPHTVRCLWDELTAEGLADSLSREDVERHILVSFNDMKRFTGISDEAYERFLERTHRIGEEEIEPKAVPFPDAEAVLSAIVKNGGRNYLYTHRNATARWYLDAYGHDKVSQICNALGLTQGASGFPWFVRDKEGIGLYHDS